MTAVNRCDQCGKVQQERFNIFVRVLEPADEAPPPSAMEIMFGMAQHPKIIDLEYCSFGCASMAFTLYAAQEKADSERR